MREMTTNGKTLLFVEVPEYAINFKVDNYPLLETVLEYEFTNGEAPELRCIPQDRYQILGKSTELSEEQIVEWKRIGRKIEYRNYRNGKFNLGNPHDSYLSLLEANGIDNNKHYLVIEKI